MYVAALRFAAVAPRSLCVDDRTSGDSGRLLREVAWA